MTTAEERASKAAYMREYKKRHPEKIREAKKKYYYENKEKVAEQNRKWREENKEHRAKYMSANREKYLEHSKRWKRENRARSNELKMESYYRHHDEEKERRRKRYVDNREDYRRRAQEYRTANRDRLNAEKRAMRKEKFCYWSFQRTRSTCRRDGTPFDLTLEWITSRVEGGCCEMSGLPFDLTTPRGPNSPSIDRRDPKGGYTMDNCRVILWFLNRAMSNLGEDFCLEVFGRVINRRMLETARRLRIV